MKKILIIDDSPLIRTIHSNIAVDLGLAVFEAGNGNDAIKVYEEEKPDIILIDLLMPDMDGFEVIKKINVFQSNVNIIICSTDKQKYRKEEALNLGVSDFLAKPVNAEKLKEVLMKI